MLKSLILVLIVCGVTFVNGLLSGRAIHSLSVEQKMNKIQELNERAHELPFIEQKLKTRKWFTRIDDCPEFSIFQNFTLWENPRLSKSVVPLDYDIELYTPLFGVELYSGLAIIQLDLNERTDTFIIHSKLIAEQGIGLFDRNNRSIEIKCAGYYPVNDYFVIRTQQPVERNQAPLLIEYLFIGFLNIYESGLFEIEYNDNNDDVNNNNNNTQMMIASHFEPEDARKAFPCFDEPSFKATFKFSIDHPNNTIALSNMPPEFDEPIEGQNNTIRTRFIRTPKLPTHLLALCVFNKNDFTKVEGKTSDGNIPLNVWARKKYVDNGMALDVSKMSLDIFNWIEEFFFTDALGVPYKIDLFALPEYPDDAIGHWGLPLFRESKLLFKEETANEYVKQNIALLIAKQFTEFWFGGLVSIAWWDELWLQEGICTWYKYKIVDGVYTDWQVNDQFTTEELIPILISDGYPSSHPVIKPIYDIYDIYALYDDVETSKVAAILRMVENEIGTENLEGRLYRYLLQFQYDVGVPDRFFELVGKIRDWDGKEFFMRWFLQSNYPSVSIRLNRLATNESTFINQVHIIQDRFTNSEDSIFALDLLYPSPYNFTWYIPLKCYMGRSSNDSEPLFIKFDISKREHRFTLESRDVFVWVHCDTNFAGYYEMDYSIDNWKQLGLAMKAQNIRLEAEDRANIIHNLFMNSFSEKDRYYELVDVLTYLRIERDLIPWRAAYKHIMQLISILEYRISFYAVAKFFNIEMREIEQSRDLWSKVPYHTEGLLRQTILEMACRLQDGDCLKNASSYWPIVATTLLDDSAINTLEPHTRPLVYNYHFQNTYGFRDWELALGQYKRLTDLQEQHLFLEALTYTRLPSLLYRFLKSEVKLIDFFDTIKYMAQNTIGREIIWLTYRRDFIKLLQQYGLEDPDLGQSLLDITSTFDSEFLFYELLKFIVYTPAGAELDARFKALEIVSTNIVWLFDKEEEIIQAFGRPRDIINHNESFNVDKSRSRQFKNEVKQWITKYDVNNTLSP